MVAERNVRRGQEKSPLVQMAYASSVGIALVLVIFASLYFGYWLDSKYGTTPFFSLLFLVLAIAGAFRNLYVYIKRNFRDEKIIIRSLKTEPHRKRPVPAKT